MTEITPSKYAVTFGANNQHYSYSHLGDNENFLRVQENWMNDRLQAYGFAFLNDVYDALGFPRTRDGQFAGWIKGDTIDFNIIKIELIDSGRVEFVLNFMPQEDILHILP